MEIIQLEHKQIPFSGILYPSTKNQGSVLIALAMGITSNYYSNFANWLSQQGFTVMVIDYQGTGTSESQIRQPITFNDWTKNIELAGRWLKNSYPETPLVFLGHSIGSQLFGFVGDTLLFDKAVMLASSTGYWKDANAPRKWVNYFLLNMILPLSNLIWGYTNAKVFKQGENYTKLPAFQWRKWCMDKEYLKVDLDDKEINNYNDFTRKIILVWFSDDPIANEITTLKLARLFKKAKIQRIEISPLDVGKREIGHARFLSRKFSDKLRPEIIINIRHF